MADHSEARDTCGGFRRLLIAVDLATGAEGVCRYGLFVGELSGAEMELVHVWRSSTVKSVTVAREHAQRGLREFGESLGLAETALRQRLEYGDPYLTILQLAQLSSYDLLVIGCSAPGKARLDGTAYQLLRTSRPAVLLVPSRSRIRVASRPSLGTVLVPVVEARALRSALPQALRIAALAGTAVELLFTVDSEAAAEAESEVLLSKIDQRAPIERRRENLDLRRALEKRAATGDLGLCVVGARAEGFARAGVDAPPSVAVTQSCPLLTVRPQD